MLKNKIIVKKIRNITLLFMVLMIMIGAYSNIRRSRAEDVISVVAKAIDSYGLLEKEDLLIDAKAVEKDMYEIELPETINTKKYNEIINITLENPTSEDILPEIKEELIQEEAVQEELMQEENDAGQVIEEQTEERKNGNELKIIDNKIYLTREEIQTKVINMNIVYDSALINIEEDGTINKKILAEMSLEEKEQARIGKNTELYYNRILRYEDEENSKLVEVKGYLLNDVKLQVNEVEQEQIKKIFGENDIDVAYDIKLLREYKIYKPIDEANPESEMQETIETVEIEPQNYGENCEVVIKDVNIQQESTVYHVNDDNTYDEILVKENGDKSVSFDTDSFSIYAVGTGGLGISAGETWKGTGFTATSSDTSTNGYYKSLSITATATSGYVLAGTAFMSSSSGQPSAGNYTATVSTDGTWYFRVAYHKYDGEALSTTLYYSGISSSFNIDKTGPTTPTVKVSKESSSSNYSTSNITVSASGSTDAKSGFSYYQYKVGSGSWTEGSSYTVSSTGATTVSFRAVDKLGNVSSTASKTVYIDKVEPTPNLTMKLGSSSGSDYTNNTWATQDVYIALSSSDSNSGIASQSYKITGAITVAEGATGARTLTKDGTYTVTVTAKDGAGNSDTESYTIKIDKTKPYISLPAMNGTEGILASYDAENNTGNGHSASATTWKNLVGTSYNGTVVGAQFVNGQYLQFDGVDDWVNCRKDEFINYIYT